MHNQPNHNYIELQSPKRLRKQTSPQIAKLKKYFEECSETETGDGIEVQVPDELDGASSSSYAPNRGTTRYDDLKKGARKATSPKRRLKRKPKLKESYRETATILVIDQPPKHEAISFYPIYDGGDAQITAGEDGDTEHDMWFRRMYLECICAGEYGEISSHHSD